MKKCPNLIRSCVFVWIFFPSCSTVLGVTDGSVSAVPDGKREPEKVCHDGDTSNEDVCGARGDDVLASDTTEKETTTNQAIVIAGYLPDYRFYININEAAAHLTDVMLFSIEPKADGSIKDTCCLSSSHYQQARDARAHKNGDQPLKILVTVGGGGRSGAFSAIAADPDKRIRLTRDLYSLCVREELDGVDFDWEQPQTRRDMENYVTLLKETSAAFHVENDSSHFAKVVTVALHPHQALSEEVCSVVDRVHLMAYDMIGRDGAIRHHADYDNVVSVVEKATAVDRRRGDGGCSRSKLVLGIPAYARHGQRPSAVKTFAEIVDEKTSAARFSSKDAKNMKPNHRGFLFDAPSQVARKVRLAKKKKLGGVFFWEIGQDKQHETLGPGGILLESASRAAAGK